MTGFTRHETPFSKAKVLEEGYQPETIHGRDNELEEIHGVLKDVIQADPPSNAFVYGESGLGKTACVRYKINELQESAGEFDDINVNVIWQNCDGCSSSYQVAIQLANSLISDPRDELPPSGLPKAEVYDTMFEQFRELSTDDEDVMDYIIIVLDEVDNIGNKDRILYQIPRAQDNDKLTSLWPCVIGISNDMSFQDQLRPKVQSSLCEHEIRFSRYNANQLRAILQQRAEKAFKDDKLDDEVVPLCAAYGAQEEGGDGDARYALDVLRKAGRIARNNKDSIVTTDHVDDAHDQLERERIREAISDVSSHELLTLGALTYFHTKGETPAARSEIWERYRMYASDALEEVRTSRRMHDWLKNFSMIGLLEQDEVQNGPGESYFQYDLDMLTEEMVVQALKEESRYGTLLPADLKESYS